MTPRKDAVRAGIAAGEAWRFYDLGHGYCTYDFFDRCPHHMACAKCAFYRPKDSAKPLMIEGKTGLLRLKQEIPLTDAEIAAVDDGVTAIAYAGRAIDGQEPKYRFPVGFRKFLILFNLHRVIARKARIGVVVEGFFDAIAVHQAGYPAVGLMGSTLSRPQEELLVSHFDRVVLMLDGDDAGRQGTAAIDAALKGRMSVTAISLEDGSQPDQLPSDQLLNVISEHWNCPPGMPGRADTRTNASGQTSGLGGGRQP